MNCERLYSLVDISFPIIVLAEETCNQHVAIKEFPEFSPKFFQFADQLLERLDSSKFYQFTNQLLERLDSLGK